MFTLSTIRHSASHVLAQAVQKLFPNAKLGIGPAIDDGFYYDFDLEHTISDQDLEKIEYEMNQIIKENQSFSSYTLNKEDSIKQVQNLKQPYKIEIIDSLNKEEYSFYKNGPFIDLCRGPHVNHTQEIGVIKLLKVSGAYWKGSEKNKMLQRIYGTAFHNQADLDNYLHKLEEAKKETTAS